MHTKTFQANTALETLQLVQTEFGANAIVVSMREVPGGPIWSPWNKSSVEIVAAMPEDGVPQPMPKETSGASVLRPSTNHTGVEFVEEMPEIEWDMDSEKQLADLRTKPHPKLKLNLKPGMQNPLPAAPEAASSKMTSSTPKADIYIPPTLKKIRQQLLDQGVDGVLVENLVSLALEALSPATLGDGESCKKSIVQLLGAELPVQQGAKKFVSGNVVCVIGGSGSGKTSSIAKLALYYSQTLNKNITWVCADTVRSGAVAEARSYADALGFNLKLVYVPEDLKDLLADAQPDDLFLVDTPGYNPYSENQMVELGALLSELPRRVTYLVAPATIKESDLFQLSASLGIFHLDGMIVTKLDETRTFGNVYNFARKNRIPLGFFAKGRDAARDLETADPIRLASALFGKEWN